MEFVIFQGFVYSSDYAGTNKTFTYYYGIGDVFKFKNIPDVSQLAGLESGQVYRDGSTLKIK